MPLKIWISWKFEFDRKDMEIVTTEVILVILWTAFVTKIIWLIVFMNGIVCFILQQLPVMTMLVWQCKLRTDRCAECLKVQVKYFMPRHLKSTLISVDLWTVCSWSRIYLNFWLHCNRQLIRIQNFTETWNKTDVVNRKGPFLRSFRISCVNVS